MQYYSFAALSLIVCTAAAAHWQPIAGTPWQIVLSDPLSGPYPPNIQAIDGDLYTNPTATWTDLRSRGIKTICYFSAGSYENWRPDVNQFHNDTDLGAPLDGWPGEWWLNTNSANVRNIMKQRMDLAVQKGCDAIDPDNIDAYDNDGGGLGLTEDDAVSYVQFLAFEAHSRNLSMGLKNGGAIVTRVLDVVDFQVNEQCEQYDECDTFRPFIDANKPVFGIEYTKSDSAIPDQDEVQDICTNPARQGFSTLIKHMNLNSWLIACNVTASSSNGNSSSIPTPTPTLYSSAGHRPSVTGISLLLGLFAGALFLP